MKEEIIKLLSDVEQKEDVENFASYCLRLSLEKTKDGKLKNTFMQYKKPAELANFFRRVMATGLVFDGKHITLQSTGISYDYIAYKNKMLLVYPESQIDMSLVFAGDTFDFRKESGKVFYSHKIADPFKASSKDADIIGAYCVVKNNRGEFLNTLNKLEIEKHRKVAKTDYIWKAWFGEMVLKTIIKKACKQHFDDVFTKIEEIDNENNDIENPIDLELELKQKVDDIKTIEELKAFYLANKGKGKDFDAYVNAKKKSLLDAQKKTDETPH